MRTEIDILVGKSDPVRRRSYSVAVGWTGIALLGPEKPRLEDANFILRLEPGWYE